MVSALIGMWWLIVAGAKKKRVIRYPKIVVPLSELKARSEDHNMTVSEYVAFLNKVNQSKAQRERRRNKSTQYGKRFKKDFDTRTWRYGK